MKWIAGSEILPDSTFVSTARQVNSVRSLKSFSLNKLTNTCGSKSNNLLCNTASNDIQKEKKKPIYISRCGMSFLIAY